MAKIDLSNKTREERKKFFESYIKGRLFHNQQRQIIDVNSLRNKFKVTHIKEKQRIVAFFSRMLIYEIYPLQIKISDEYRIKNIKRNKERNKDGRDNKNQ